MRYIHLFTYLAHSIHWCLLNFALQKQSKDRFGLEGDEESTMLEESVSPKKWVVSSVEKCWPLWFSSHSLVIHEFKAYCLIVHVITFLPAQQSTPQETWC